MLNADSALIINLGFWSPLQNPGDWVITIPGSGLTECQVRDRDVYPYSAGVALGGTYA